MVDSTSSPGAGVPPLADAIEKSKQAAETIKEAADDLAVIHTVLDQELPEDARGGDVGSAVEQTKVIEKRLSETADLLDEAQKTLEQHVDSAAGKDPSS